MHDLHFRKDLVTNQPLQLTTMTCYFLFAFWPVFLVPLHPPRLTYSGYLHDQPTECPYISALFPFACGSDLPKYYLSHLVARLLGVAIIPFRRIFELVGARG